jgi:hypothetical protein
VNILTHRRQPKEGSLFPATCSGCASRDGCWPRGRSRRTTGAARFYTLTTAGKKQLGVEESRFAQMFGAIMRVMKTT